MNKKLKTLKKKQDPSSNTGSGYLTPMAQEMGGVT